jgi:ribulose-phosphate 3-epimerase
VNVSPSSTSTSTALAELKAAAPVILPSLLLCDFGHLADEVARLEAAGARALHLDVMDGVFVPNMTYGMTIVEAVRKLTKLPIDVHLMITRPERYVADFQHAGADIVTIHVEATDLVAATLEQIRNAGAAAGLALNPLTPIAAIAEHVSACDLILVMSVEAGFGGQKFNPIALEKLTYLRSIVSPQTVLEIDGGINAETIARSSAAGADLFVVGSAIFHSDDYARSVANLTHLASPRN